MHAKVVIGKGAAGVTLGQKAEIVDRGGKQFVKGDELREWGKVAGFCYEGSTCTWKAKGGGRVTLEISNGRVRQIHVATKRWGTARGIRKGSKARAVLDRYPRSRLRTVCWGPYGVVGTGFLLKRGGASTLFALNPSGTRVFAIRLLQHAGHSCD
jgi:hypothetical protein